MEDELLKVAIDKNKVGSILKMVEIRLKRVQNTRDEEFASLLVEDYYELIKELATAVLNLEGYKTLSHKLLFDVLAKRFNVFTDAEIDVIDDLRKTRNRIVYDGFFVKQQYISSRMSSVQKIVEKLRRNIEEKINTL